MVRPDHRPQNPPADYLLRRRWRRAFLPTRDFQALAGASRRAGSVGSAGTTHPASAGLLTLATEPPGDTCGMARQLALVAPHSVALS